MNGMRTLALALALSAACSAQGELGPSGDKADDQCANAEGGIGLKIDFGQRAFNTPVAAVPHPTETDFWYIAEQRGIVWRMVLADGAVTPRRFLDGRSLVNSDSPDGGLLGIALHPNFDQNGFFYLSYTAASSDSPANQQSRISRFQTADGQSAGKDTEEILLTVEQPLDDNNGGQIAFGPDGFLYIGFGDGGGGGDPEGNAQDPNSLLGKVLRIDVDSTGASTSYGIPTDNPFASAGGRPEIYASGFRNPWRFNFDSETGELWLGDVGQDAVEEIDIVALGGNYGWNVREGDQCFGSSTCDEFDAPIATYGHAEGSSITGGFVYRGTALPDLVGSYVFADASAGTIWALQQNATNTGWERRPLRTGAGAIASLAQGTNGELFALDQTSGNIFAITAGEVCPESTPAAEADASGPITSFQQLYDEVISVDCAPCHTQRALGGLRMVDVDTAFANLIEVPAETSACAGRTRVIPGDAENSVFSGKVSGVNLCGPLMPLGQTPNPHTIEAIGQWIESGAKR